LQRAFFRLCSAAGLSSYKLKCFSLEVFVKNILWVIMVFAMVLISRHGVAGNGISGNAHGSSGEKRNAASGGYNPAIAYPGIYEKLRIYKRWPGSSFWRGTDKPAHLRDITCSDAISSLSASGVWKGNLNKDGSCGLPPEPPMWAVGNYLNFEAVPDQE
jgi:hypothetical protein